VKKENKLVIFGVHAVESAMRADYVEIEELFFQSKKVNKKIQFIQNVAKDSKIATNFKSRKDLDILSDFGNHQGIVALAKKLKQNTSLKDLLQSVSESSLILILDQIQDPHNLGACLRTAECAGVDAILLPKDGSCKLNDTVRKVASGAAEIIQVFYVPNLVQAMESLKEHGYWIYGAAENAENSLYQCEMTGRIAMVMGSEGRGMRRLTQQKCDFLINIPMQGQIPNLNVSVATGIFLFEVLRQSI